MQSYDFGRGQVRRKLIGGLEPHRCYLLNLGFYTPNLATHQTLDEVAAAARIAGPVQLEDLAVDDQGDWTFTIPLFEDVTGDVDGFLVVHGDEDAEDEDCTLIAIHELDEPLEGLDEQPVLINTPSPCATWRDAA